MANVLLSESEKNYILQSIQDDIRVDGRSCDEFREMELELDVVSNTNGSARLRLCNSDVLVGVKAELETPKPLHDDEGRIEIFVDCSANAAPEFEGRGGEEVATEISRLLTHAYTTSRACLDLKSLCIRPGQYSWLLYIDVVILEFGGNLLDAISVATKAALCVTRIPKVEIVSNEEGQTDVELSDDPFECMTVSVGHLPCFITINRIGQNFIVDASIEEEQCSQAAVSYAVTDNGSIVASRKSGSGSLHAESLVDAMQTAARVGKRINEELSKTLASYDSMATAKKSIGFLR